MNEQKTQQTDSGRQFLVFLTTCFWGCLQPVNLDAVEGAHADCEQATYEQLLPLAKMLPGRDCIACHKDGSQAHELPWTVAGTIYDRKDGLCNEGGQGNVKIELADETRQIILTLFTNRSGNFFSAEPLRYQNLSVRISRDGQEKVMPHAVTHGNCAFCHRAKGLARGHIYLP